CRPTKSSRCNRSGPRGPAQEAPGGNVRGFSFPPGQGQGRVGRRYAGALPGPRVASYPSGPPRQGRDMYTLYYAPGAASMVVHWRLIEFGTRHELKRPNLDAKVQKPPTYLANNPRGFIRTPLAPRLPLTE